MKKPLAFRQRVWYSTAMDTETAAQETGKANTRSPMESTQTTQHTGIFPETADGILFTLRPLLQTGVNFTGSVTGEYADNRDVHCLSPVGNAAPV